MAPESVRFGEFTLLPGECLLIRGSERTALNGRYLDALVLLLREPGRLIPKERFMDEVWRGVPVTDEALTQCIRTLRRQLGDDATRPHFIQTVPRRGYRFIADVHWGADEASSPSVLQPTTDRYDPHAVLRTAGFAGLGGMVAGAGGGMFYGLAASPAGGIGALSMLLVLVVLVAALGFLGGLGVGAGIAAASLISNDKWQWSTAGGMFGGLAIGGMARLLGLDGFALLFGRAPAHMTGAAEGVLLGAALGFGAWLAARRAPGLRGGAVIGTVAGGGAGLLVALTGGHLLGGSLASWARDFPDARFRLGSIGALLGEDGFGSLSEIVTATLEGALFGLCVGGGLALARMVHSTKG